MNKNLIMKLNDIILNLIMCIDRKAIEQIYCGNSFRTLHCIVHTFYHALTKA